MSKCRRFWFVLAASCLLGTLAILYGQPLLVRASARVHVRFRATVDASARAVLERRFSLEPVEQVAPDTWRYNLTDTSVENVAGLVRNEDVADTHYVDRSTFKVQENADPRLRRPGGLGQYWPALAYLVVDFGPLMLVPASGVALVSAAWPQLWPRSLDVFSMLLGAVFSWTATRQRRYRPSGLASLLSALAFGSAVAAVVTLMGTHDLENYEHSFFSLDRGTKVNTLKVLGHPGYTLALGLGVRLPLHGNLSSSPVAMLAPHLPEPITYWLLLTFAVGLTVLIVRHALEPLCGRLVFWVGACLLFCSLPIANYTIADDWPETALTYCTFVACVFAPHALLAIGNAAHTSKRRLLGGLGLLGLVWGAIACSHPGYWPQIALTLAVSAALASIRTDHPSRTRLAVVALLGGTSIGAVGLLAPDVLREMRVAGDMLQSMHRFSQGHAAGLWASNWPWPLPTSFRAPFTFLLLTVTSLGIGLRWPGAARRRLILGSGLASLGFGFGATHLSSVASAYAPSAMWALRDPAIGFAVLGAAVAAGVLGANRARHAIRARYAGILLLACGLLGPVIAARVTLIHLDVAELFDAYVSPRGMTPQEARISGRGLDSNQVAVGSRIALWPGVGHEMRNRKDAQADFADAGYTLVTASVKQRTMKRLVEPMGSVDPSGDGNNNSLFNQTTYLPAEVLCSPPAVRFLQLNVLLAPSRNTCNPWQAVTPTLSVDGRFFVHTSGAIDSRVRALPSAVISDAMRQEPALGSGSSLLSVLVPLAGTSVAIGPRDVVIHQDHPSSSAGLTLLVPVAYDSAWKASIGRVDNVGGLLALTAATRNRVVLSFEPDTVLMLRSIATSLSQLVTCLGLVGLACVAPGTKSSEQV